MYLFVVVVIIEVIIIGFNLCCTLAEVIPFYNVSSFWVIFIHPLVYFSLEFHYYIHKNLLLFSVVESWTEILKQCLSQIFIIFFLHPPEWFFFNSCFKSCTFISKYRSEVMLSNFVSVNDLRFISCILIACL